MAKKQENVPRYGTAMRRGIQYYRTRITDADGKRVDLYAETCEELQLKEMEARRQVEEAVSPENIQRWQSIARSGCSCSRQRYLPAR